ncbi:MAG: hypothetical protein U0359_21645 [Byssovorax sp.]
MRWFHAAFVSLLFGALVLACNTVDPDECWPNTSGGLGGGGTIPIGAGVGATSSGDFLTPPPYDPLGNGSGGAPYNPCVEPESQPPKSQPPVSCEVPDLGGDGATAWACTDTCLSKCPAPGGALYVKFSPSDFPFVTTIKDDGKDLAGGYQEAKVNLMFTRAIIPWSVVTWWCPFRIGMPLRTEKMGKISAKDAANYSVEITELVAKTMDFSLPQGIFCEQYVPKVDMVLKSTYPKLGAGAYK